MVAGAWGRGMSMGVGIDAWVRFIWDIKVICTCAMG